ncbi:MAG TPA: flavodoxin domain-containing protein [Candidatus Limnocylindrales bacterium]|nr:flavodoxin domain-containing protein [Candidatus Limnocylindrales bacterium]
MYATKHGATRGIAERIAETLRTQGLDVTIADAKDEPVTSGADAFVIGSAAYIGKWQKEAIEFVRSNEAFLRTRPVWLFSSGPVGTEEFDKKGNTVLVAPEVVAELAESIGARGTQVFFGAWDPTQSPASVGERFALMIPKVKELLPLGDFRDWEAIDAWAIDIAHELEKAPVAAG